MVVIASLSVGHQTGGVGPNYTMSSSLLPVASSFLLYIVVENIDNCPVSSCNLSVPMGGGEIRVFLPHHLDSSVKIIFN